MPREVASIFSLVAGVCYKFRVPNWSCRTNEESPFLTRGFVCCRSFSGVLWMEACVMCALSKGPTLTGPLFFPLLKDSRPVLPAVKYTALAPFSSDSIGLMVDFVCIHALVSKRPSRHSLYTIFLVFSK